MTRGTAVAVLDSVTTHGLDALAATLTRSGAGTDIQNEMRAHAEQYVSLLAREKGEELPTQRTFVRWLRANPPSEKNELDPWGHSYYMKVQNDTYTVGSFGPDGIKGNVDDIVKSTRL